MTKQQWDILREKFFKQCTEPVEVGDHWTGIDILKKVCVAPHDLFEFFKREITEILSGKQKNLTQEYKEWHEIYSAIAHGICDTDTDKYDIRKATDNVVNCLKNL